MGSETVRERRGDGGRRKGEERVGGNNGRNGMNLTHDGMSNEWV